MKMLIFKVFLIVISIAVLFGGLFYFFQEKLIFYPDKLDKDFRFTFGWVFEERNICTADNFVLNSLLFKADEPKGIILYIHGNAGALDSWGLLSSVYTNLGYDVFFFDYRGFGKSEGTIQNQAQLLNDVQIVYDEIRKDYEENKIIILGFSIGTGPAAYLASQNNPSMLILQAPYYSMKSLIKSYCPIVPDFLIKYKLETNWYLEDCKMPVVIFHGQEDEIINYNNSVRLNQILKGKDIFITLSKTGHNDITESRQYLEKLKEILSDEQIP